MTYNILTIDINEGVALLTINREKSLNALNRDTFTEIDHAFSENLPSVEGLKGSNNHRCWCKGICCWRRYYGV